MRHRLADKTYISTGQMLILMFDFIHGHEVIIFTEKNNKPGRGFSDDSLRKKAFIAHQSWICEYSSRRYRIS
ncbi:hypothetical protein GMA19_04567 [Paenibacillus polymyxa E681]|nr:hypothetical protein PPE_06480 [Paenibacillus polymyxa E681]QNV59350.1 hypothetical protein GE561_04578 [Paenibacillus polymyxa E681]QNV64176.1 hypothetical protein GMA19_04567 [Paenibacillus polymyxa E681]